MTTRTYHHLAHLPSFADCPIVYFTVTAYRRRRVLDNAVTHEVLRAIWERSSEKNGWYVGDYLLMPDHLHGFARANRTADFLHVWMGMWKSLSARELKCRMGFQPPVWQKDYFDRYLRSSESYAEKWEYVRMNPVRAGLVSDVEKWPYYGRVWELRM